MYRKGEGKEERSWLLGILGVGLSSWVFFKIGNKISSKEEFLIVGNLMNLVRLEDRLEDKVCVRSLMVVGMIVVVNKN